MINPFSRPHTTGEWLLSSICWTVSCLGSWWGGNYMLSRWPGSEDLTFYFFPIGFLATHWLLWRYVVLRGWLLVGWEETPAPFWLKMVAYTWFALLVVYQLGCIVLILLMMAFLF